MCWSKWIRYDTLMELDLEQHVPGTIDSKREFLEKASHRTIHPCEIVYDIDEKDLYYVIEEGISIFEYKVFPDIKAHSKYVNDHLICGDRITWWTGNKSYHIHTFDQKLFGMRKRQRLDFKRRLLLFAGADIQKASDNTMIAIEGEPHYRSGRLKSQVVL